MGSRLLGAVIAVLAVAGCAESSSPLEAATSSSVSSTSTTGEPTSSTIPPSSTTTADLRPPTQFEADRRYDPSDVGLPDEYAADPGDDAYGQGRPRRIRGDLADYALAVRARDAARADQLSWRLQTYPFAVCAADERLAGGFQGYVSRVDERIAAAGRIAAELAVEAPTAPTPTTDPPLAFAVEEARRRFCPGDGTRVGDPLGALPGWDSTEDGLVDRDDVVIPWTGLPYDRTDRPLRRFSIAAAYVAVAAAPDVASTVTGDIILFPAMCSDRDDYLRMAEPPTVDQYYDTESIDADDVRKSLLVSLIGLATVELGCPEDWMDL